MSRSSRVLRHLQKRIPGTLVCKSVLVVMPVQVILRGFLLETTIERNLVYLWRVVTPLFHPMRGLSLAHSERIGGDKVFIDPKDYDDAARRIAEIIVEGGHLDYLRTIETPHDFLHRHRPTRADLPIFSGLAHLGWTHFIRGLTRYLVGEETEALQQLRTMNREIDLSGQDRWFFRPYLKQFLEASEQGSESAHRLLGRWVDENVEKFGLGEARRSE